MRAVLSLALFFILSKLGGANNPQARPIQILNEARSKVEVYWIHPNTGAASLMSNPNIMPGADFMLNSFVTHKFRVDELPNKQGVCNHAPNQVCRSDAFVVSENSDQIARVTEDIKVVFEDNKLRATQEAEDLVSECQENARAKLAMASKSRAAQALDTAMQELIDCVQGGVAHRLQVINEEIAFQSTVRKEIAGQLENYTCADDTLESSPDVSENIWIHKEERPVVRRKVHVKHDRPASKIMVIENFIRPDECEAMQETAKRTLHHATVADGRGGSRLSESRKAMQAGIKVPWNLESQDNPIARLSRRVYDFTNHVLGLGIEEFGQEDLMSIQYFGRGLNDTEPDRYTPHCDGDCTGLKHKYGTRMATMVMYCETATRGGHTNFRNAGVHVKPVVGSGIFFSYIDPETKTMDTGFTEHSGCPVYEGSKKIVTQWIRYGVDSENPWDSFNTLGVKRAEMEALENDNFDTAESMIESGDSVVDPLMVTSTGDEL